MTYHNAYAARIDDNNIVVEIISIPYMEDDDVKINEYCDSIGIPGKWLDCSYLGTRRGRFPGDGYRYDEETNEFVPPEWEYIDGEWQDPNPPEIIVEPTT